MVAKKLSINGLQVCTGYIYLLSFCPPEGLAEFNRAGTILRKALALEAGLNEKDYFKVAGTEACRRMVAFYQASRTPDLGLVDKLSEALLGLDGTPATLLQFQQQMTAIAKQPRRAKKENRLHRNKGCQFCADPCKFGYFSLVSKPDFELLRSLLEGELKKPADRQDPLHAAWAFATAHLWRTFGQKRAFIDPEDLGNLAYCLMVRGGAHSRYPLPETQFKVFQLGNQLLLRR